MPYTMKNKPDAIKDLPKAAQEMWIAAYNSASESGKSEESCMKIAWGAVKREYEQDADGKWTKIAKTARTRGELIALAVSAAEATKQTIQVIRAGDFVDMSGTEVTITKKDLARIVANSNAALAGQEIPVDIGHPDPGDGAPAAAWYRKFFTQLVDGVEWVCAEVELTTHGAQALADKLYKYFSAEMDLGLKTITGGGFVNKPAVTGQQVVGSLAEYLRPRGEAMLPSWFEFEARMGRRALGLLEFEMSHEDLSNKLYQALQAKYRDPLSDDYSNRPFIFMTYADHIIAKKGDEYFSLDYSLDGDTCTLGEPVPVEMDWKPKAAESAALARPASAPSNTTPRGGDPDMDPKEVEAKLEAARAEERAKLVQQQADFDAKLAKAREDERAKVLAEANRTREISEFATRVTTGAKVVPYKKEELIALLTELSDDARLKMQAMLDKIVTTGLVDLSERGSAAPGVPGKKALDAGQKIALARFLKAGGKLEMFCKANGLTAETHDLAEFAAN